VITAGAPAPFRTLENFRRLLPAQATLCSLYGATESLPITVMDSREALSGTLPQTARGAGVCIGRPVQNVCLRLIQITDDPIETWDPALEAGPNSVGEITVKGPAVTRSYAGRPELDRLAKIREGADVVHRTGDLGSMDAAGRVWFFGRKSQRVNTPQGTFFTEQIEGIFNAHPAVRRTALVGLHAQPVLWVELRREQRGADKRKLQAELRQLAQAHPLAAQIERFLFMNEFPTDVRHNSKILREKLASLAGRRLA
jgi:acyl-CoA synthetase (AMP-forming)/AMP-acid ligase II